LTEARKRQLGIWRISGRMLSTISQPNLIYGIGFGIAFTVAFIVSAQLGIITNVLVGLLSLLLLSVFGALFFFFIANFISTKPSLVELLTKQGKAYGLVGVLDDLRTYLRNEPGHEAIRSEAEVRLGQSFATVFGVFGSILGRYFSLVFLVSVLGGAATFAIFAATFIQAERLEVQNRLIESQLHLAEAQRQTALAISLENLEDEIGRLEKLDDQVILPESLVLKIVALSRTFRPYRFVEYSLRNSLNVVQRDRLPFDEEFRAKLTPTPLSRNVLAYYLRSYLHQ
jgi:hypothetical protein